MGRAPFYAHFIVSLRGPCAQNTRKKPCGAFLCLQKTRFAYNPRRFLLCVLLGVYSEKLPFWAPPGHFSFKKTHRFHFPLFCKRYGFYSEKPVAETLGFAGFRRKQPPKCIEKGALRGLWDSFSCFSRVIQV